MTVWTAGFIEGIPSYVFWIVAVSLALPVAFGLARSFRSAKLPVYKQAAGSRIALALGEGFAPSDRFTGFVHEGSGASIVLMELPFAAFDQLANLGNARDSFAAQGVAGVVRKELPGRLGEYIYLQGEQKTALVDYAKYILIFRGEQLTGMVTANIPKAALASRLITRSEIERILRSAEVRAEAPRAPRLFTLGYLGPFEEDLLVLGTTKGYRLNGAAAAKDNGALQPIFLVAPSLTQAPIPNLELFAERTFNSIDQIRDKAIETVNNLKVAGLNAVEVLGRGVDKGSGAAAFIYQLIIEARHGGYFRLLGLAPENKRPNFLLEFRKIASNFHPAEDPRPN